MTREQMMNEVMRTRGLEDDYTIWFCTLAEDESMSDDAVLNAMIAVLAMGFGDEDEEEE